VGQSMTVAEVMQQVLRDRQFFDESQGGVTFSGGEPLLQPAFLLSLLRACREQSLHATLDTCGYAATDVVVEAAGLSNLILYDLKSMDPRVHAEQTGVSNELILKNLRALASADCPLWIRIPLIPGFNCDRRSLSAITDFLVTISGVQQVNVLPYHDLGAHKQRQFSGSQSRLSSSVRREPKGDWDRYRCDTESSHLKASFAKERGGSDELGRATEEAVQLLRAAGLTTYVGG
jgi:pyruvate formate lyase activating enzyme